MTPKEKAEELIESFMNLETKADEIINDILLGDMSIKFKYLHCKKCALIAVDQQTESVHLYSSLKDLTNWVNYLKYWQEVKNEIEKL